MLLRFADFKGEIPRLHPRLLPVNFSQVARNTRLEDGAIGPVNAPVTAHTFPSTPQTFIKFNGTFTSFTQPNVNATVGPVAQDRLYYTGDGFPKMRVGSTNYDLAVQPPGNPPSVGVQAIATPPAPNAALATPNNPATQTQAESYSYRYSVVVDGVESVASGASFGVTRTNSQNLNVTGFSVPAGATEVRIFRSGGPIGGAGTTSRFGLIASRTPAQVAGGFVDNFVAAPDVTQAPIEQTDKIETQETITYVYTYVTSFGEESAPSPPSDIANANRGDKINVSVLAPLQTGRGIQFIRLYRSKTSLTGITDFYFVTELNAVSQTYQDELKTVLGEILSTTDFDVPEPTMLGLISLPNGMMAGHAGRELMFCEPFQPHAWPIKYRLTTDTEIVGLGAFGSFVAVMTKGAPYMVQGSEPGLMVMEKLENTLPCLSRFSIVDMGYSVAYASYEGLVVISQNGAQVVTRPLFTEEQWRKMRPESFRAAQLNGRYAFSYQPTVGGPRKFGIIDLSGEQPFYMEADIAPTLMHYAPADGALYYTEGGAVVKEWDPKAGSTVLKQTWRSKRTILQGIDNFGAFLIETDPVDGTKQTPSDPDCTIRFYADGNLIHTSTVTNRPSRLPAGFLADRWEVEIEGYVPVTGISLATDIFELAEG